MASMEGGAPAIGLRFVDLFAGLGGFHLALQSLGATCVLACEKDPKLRSLYEVNFGVLPAEDIRDLSPSEIPDHDILCAGFPCQSFSKAGSQLGLGCLRNGDLIHEVLDIVRCKKPKFLLMENVPNLFKHDNGTTWALIKQELELEGYDVDHSFYSPHHFGIPQIRERMFIVGALSCEGGLQNFMWPLRQGKKPSIRSILDVDPTDARPIGDLLADCLNVWQCFLDSYPAHEELPSFPIWSMEFGATYPTEGPPPSQRPLEEMLTYKGSHGRPLKGSSIEEVLSQLPSHARGDEPFPRWKRTFIRQNRELYAANSKWLDRWMPDIQSFIPSFQKFEWNCKGERRVLWDHVLQVRASGIRVKRDSTAPSLIAMTTTQVPIIAWERRYMTPRECARLQSMDTIMLPNTPTASYRALGNAVNVEIVRQLAEALLTKRVVLSPPLQPRLLEDLGVMVTA
jgi:DNA (cytosine-5)-methyltransferase 1